MSFILTFFKQLFCKHDYKLVHQFYSDHMYECQKCKKFKVEKKL